MELLELKRICVACPSSWEGKLEGGKYLYAKYRYGCLTLMVEDEKIFYKKIGDNLDGWLNQRTLLGYLDKKGIHVTPNTLLSDDVEYEV